MEIFLPKFAGDRGGGELWFPWSENPDLGHPSRWGERTVPEPAPPALEYLRFCNRLPCPIHFRVLCGMGGTPKNFRSTPFGKMLQRPVEATYLFIINNEEERRIPYTNAAKPGKLPGFAVGYAASSVASPKCAKRVCCMQCPHRRCCYSAAISSASPSWRIISSSRSAASISAETSCCTRAAASSSSGESCTLR